MPHCPSCHAEVDRHDHHCRSCGRSLGGVALDSGIPVGERTIRELPGLILKGVGFLIAGVFVLVITMGDMGLLRPVIERTHQYIPFVNDPSCVDIFTWYEDVEKDQTRLDREMNLLYGKETPSEADIDLVINALQEHQEFLIDSNPPEDAIRLRSMYVETTGLLISSMNALKGRDQEAVMSFLDEGDRVSASIDEETDRINSMCNWNDEDDAGLEVPVKHNSVGAGSPGTIYLGISRK